MFPNVRGRSTCKSFLLPFFATLLAAPAFAALGESVAYCDAVYASLTAATATAMVKAGDNPILRVQPLFNNLSHNTEHYGNLVTYFRMKNMVPPSTKREGGL